MILMIVLSLVYSLYGAIDRTKNHTDIYYQTKDFNTLYQLHTFGGNLSYIDPCKKFTTIDTYINILAHLGLECDGPYCNNGEYYCSQNNLTNCYQVEHIIDISNVDNDCDKNIYGNIVLSYGVWNAQIGRLNWKYVKLEKMEVYGNIFEEAESNLFKCDTTCKKMIDENNTFVSAVFTNSQFVFTDEQFVFWILILICVVIIAIVFFVIIMTIICVMFCDKSCYSCYFGPCFGCMKCCNDFMREKSHSYESDFIIRY